MASNNEVWFAIPSASVAKCRRVLPAWREMGYKVAVLQNGERGEIPADVCVWRDEYPGWAQSVNILTREVVPRGCPIVVSGGDDMLPDGHKSAEELAREFLERFPTTLGVMQPHGDDFLQARHYCGSPWLGRAWCERMYGGTGPMFGGYRHNWADNELYWVSACRGLLWERPDVTQRHEHFSRLGEQPEEYWRKNVEGPDRADVQTFIARAWLGFPGHGPVAARGDGQVGGEVPAFDEAVFRERYSHSAEAYWMGKYGQALGGGDGCARLRRALERCAAEGRTRIAIFGAGSHTRGLGAALMEAPGSAWIACIIDDNPTLAGTTLWNFPIVTLREATLMRLDAVILSSKTMEDALARKASVLEERGAEVVRLYGRAEATAAA